MLRIAIIGCGAIGVTMLEMLRADTNLQVVAIVVQADGRDAAVATAARLAPAAQVDFAVPEHDVDLVVEAAGHSAIEGHVLPALRRGIDCVVASVGALSAPGLLEALEAAASEGAAQAYLVSGAVAAIDALAAARIGGLDTVRYTGRKPPQAWSGTPAEKAHDLTSLREATVIFEGSAREAATLYPKNANVAATVSIAGLGFDATQVRLIADPAVIDNVHNVEAAGAFGSFEMTIRNKPLPANSKTSALTVYSLVRTVRNVAAAIVI
jgi:aspartate dehydrogenase